MAPLESLCGIHVLWACQKSLPELQRGLSLNGVVLILGRASIQDLLHLPQEPSRRQ